ncbi:GntR family transcriptional regulator [Ornithinibacillus sp. 4-3]|uniref:GntR family transcriptional regulator n=1 Tax=Ornithinibacillus sp. 4-3 TaxID=3231488 RepID=A0AB39HQG7_9BACI
MKLPIHLSKSSHEPIYHQIEKQIQALIAGGTLPANTPLPSIRVLAKDLEISAITIRRAYQNLEIGGFIRTSQGKGTFVKEIDANLKSKVKTETVNRIIVEAVETAFQYDYTLEEIEDIFHKVIKAYNQKN